MRIVPTVIAAALITSPCFATPYFYNGNKVYEFCTTYRSLALGYVAGAYDAGQVGQEAATGIMIAGITPTTNDEISKVYAQGILALGAFCTPDKASLDQATDIFCQYLKDSPGDRHEPASILLARALAKAWPCSVPKSKKR